MSEFYHHAFDYGSISRFNIFDRCCILDTIKHAHAQRTHSHIRTVITSEYAMRECIHFNLNNSTSWSAYKHHDILKIKRNRKIRWREDDNTISYFGFSWQWRAYCTHNIVMWLCVAKRLENSKTMRDMWTFNIIRMWTHFVVVDRVRMDKHIQHTLRCARVCMKKRVTCKHTAEHTHQSGR